ncbi:hypothetical protein [Microbacterium sp. NPDC091662]|uniref:hypothetical protein n=1 Tax=Microbacterium sp. NPDC091662 TaxID=3364211 RepID=UPI00380EA552
MSGVEVFSGTSAWRLLRVLAGERLLRLCVVDSELRTYVYIWDSGRFHPNNGVYVDFVWDNELTYVPIGVEEGRVLIAARVGSLPPELTLTQRRRYLTDGHLGVEETLARVERSSREGDLMPDF